MYLNEGMKRGLVGKMCSVVDRVRAMETLASCGRNHIATGVEAEVRPDACNT